MKIEVNVNNLILIENNELNENEYNIHNIQFVFSNEYTNNLIKVALFTSDENTYKIIIQDNQCNIPPEVLAKKGCFTLGVYAFEVENETLIERFSPTPIKLFIADGSYIADENTENSEPLTPTDKEQILSILEEMQEVYTEKISEINTAIEETNNLNINVEKDGKVTTVTLTKKDGTTKTVEIDDGVSLQFMWQGTSLGIKREDQENYTFVNLQGATGLTPNIQIGTVVSGNTPSVTISGTPENPILNFTLVKGDTGSQGPAGPTGNGIASIIKTATVGLVDTYTITYTNGNTTTFTVTNGEDGEVTQEQFDALQNKVTEQENIINQMPQVSGSGTSITLNNTIDARFRKFDVEGNSTQESEGYTQLDYIQSSGTQYIDTGINGKSSLKMQLKVNISAIGTIIGYVYGHGNSFRLFPLTGTPIRWFLDWGNDGVNRISGGTFELNTDYNIEIGNRYIKDLDTNTDIISGTEVSAFSQNYNVCIFGNNNFATGKIYYLKIYDGNTLVRNFRPCYRNSDNKVGMYDLVTKTFYTNAGEGEFVAGNEVDMPNPNFPLPIKSAGDNGSITEKITNSDGTKEQTYTIPVQAPFRRNKDGTVRDKFVKVNGTWYERHYITRYIFTGEETIDYNANSIWTFRYTPSPTMIYDNPSNTNNIMCNYFQGRTSSDDLRITSYLGLICFRYDLYKTGSSDGFKTWLTQLYTNGTPLYADYILATPNDIPCTSAQIAILENLPFTYSGQTNVYSEDEVNAYMEVAGLLDLNTLVGGA